MLETREPGVLPPVLGFPASIRARFTYRMLSLGPFPPGLLSVLLPGESTALAQAWRWSTHRGNREMARSLWKFTDR